MMPRVLKKGLFFPESTMVEWGCFIEDIPLSIKVWMADLGRQPRLRLSMGVREGMVDVVDGSSMGREYNNSNPLRWSASLAN